MLSNYLSFSSSKHRQLPSPFTTGASDSDFEAAVVAGKVSEAPLVPPTPASPAGTPVVPSLPIQWCPRRNRRSPALRSVFQEATLSPANFVHPLFIHEGDSIDILRILFPAKLVPLWSSVGEVQSGTEQAWIRRCHSYFTIGTKQLKPQQRQQQFHLHQAE